MAMLPIPFTSECHIYFLSKSFFYYFLITYRHRQGFIFVGFCEIGVSDVLRMIGEKFVHHENSHSGPCRSKPRVSWVPAPPCGWSCEEMQGMKLKRQCTTTAWAARAAQSRSWTLGRNNRSRRRRTATASALLNLGGNEHARHEQTTFHRAARAGELSTWWVVHGVPQQADQPKLQLLHDSGQVVCPVCLLQGML
ncbi:hypothetical protein SEVIR_2G317701v4 [Setaria viridis]